MDRLILFAPTVRAFLQGLKEAGYVDGQNVAIEYRWANGQYDRLTALADDLPQLRVSVIAATSTPANLVAKAATTTIPIVFTTGGDPVKLRLVTSLGRPGGNVTGVTQMTGEVAPKRVELAHELVPLATAFGMIINPTNPMAETVQRNSQAAALKLGLQLNVLHASTDAELDKAFTALREMHVGALVIGTDAFFNNRLEQLATLAISNSLPVVYEYHQFVAAGGLVSYGGSIINSYRLAGGYVDRILKGERPADLPVQQATKYRTGPQSQDRKGARPRLPAVAPKSRRRDDRMRHGCPLLAQSRHGLVHCKCPLSRVKQT